MPPVFAPGSKHPRRKDQQAHQSRYGVGKGAGVTVFRRVWPFRHTESKV
jgi:hypothetical protein